MPKFYLGSCEKWTSGLYTAYFANLKGFHRHVYLTCGGYRKK